VRVGQQVPAAVALARLERLENLLLLFRSHPAKRTEAAVPGCAFQIVESPNAQLAIERRDRFGTVPQRDQISLSRGTPSRSRWI
jgi:hypothetical protein